MKENSLKEILKNLKNKEKSKIIIIFEKINN